MVDEATLREWLVNIGQRSAEERIAHLFCEIHARLSVIGELGDGLFSLPITQVELADTMGMSAVHVNRSLRSLRERGMVDFRQGVVDILDMAGLRKLAGFNPNYLHIDGGKRERPTT